LLESRLGQRFDGIVTGACSSGVWVRVFAPPTEGRLDRGGAGLRIGDKVRVKLLFTNVERGFIDFALSP
jgi:exoribonuclease-2